jgi:hypothetical protein
MQDRIAERTVSTPRLWPAMRGMNRFFAQRPLPSMMMAMCRGISSVSGISRVELMMAGMENTIEIQN